MNAGGGDEILPAPLDFRIFRIGTNYLGKLTSLDKWMDLLYTTFR